MGNSSVFDTTYNFTNDENNATRPYKNAKDTANTAKRNAETEMNTI